ncbi:MAG: regulatory protein GemA [Pseudomonadota bacterium]
MSRPARKTPAKSGRDPVLAQIHIARQELGLEDDDYRTLLEQITGKRSAKDLSPTERRRVLDEFKRRGWKPKDRGTRRWREAEPRRDHRLVLVFWRLLAEAGVVTPGRQALNAFIANPTFRAKWSECPTDLRWLSIERTSDVIEALKQMARRNGVDLNT